MARATDFVVVALLIASVHCAAARPEPAINAGHWAEASDVISTVRAGRLLHHCAPMGQLHLRSRTYTSPSREFAYHAGRITCC